MNVMVERHSFERICWLNLDGIMIYNKIHFFISMSLFNLNIAQSTLQIMGHTLKSFLGVHLTFIEVSGHFLKPSLAED